MLRWIKDFHGSITQCQDHRSAEETVLSFLKESYGTFEVVKLESAAFGGLKDLDIWEQ